LGIRHERLVSVTEDRHWHIRDDLKLSKRGEHLFRLHWLLRDGKWHIRQIGPEVRLRLKTPEGWIRLNITASQFSPSSFRVMLARAGQLVYGRGQPKPYDGWLSLTYATKVPALSLAVEAASSTTCQFLSEFILPK